MVVEALQTFGYFSLIFKELLKSKTEKFSALLRLRDFKHYLKD